jgi:hypothetical protein
MVRQTIAPLKPSPMQVLQLLPEPGRGSLPRLSLSLATMHRHGRPAGMAEKGIGWRRQCDCHAGFVARRWIYHYRLDTAVLCCLQKYSLVTAQMEPNNGSSLQLAVRGWYVRCSKTHRICTHWSLLASRCAAKRRSGRPCSFLNSAPARPRCPRTCQLWMRSFHGSRS